MTDDEQNNSEPTYRSGYVALIGRPSTGTSTLLHRLVGEKLAAIKNVDLPQGLS